MTRARNFWLVSAALILALVILVPASANREHKVHNIVLYPNKQSWCTTRNISQVITEPGCKQVTIDNNVCVGACFSYSIPHTEPSDPGEVIGPYCDSCQPSNVSYEFVKVDCTENANMKSPYLFKQVQLIHNCSCTACEEQSTRRNNPTSGQDPADTSQEHLHQHQQTPLAAPGKDQELGHHHQRAPAHAVHPLGGSDESDGNRDSDMIQDDIPEILEVVHYSENDTDPIRHTPVHDFQSHDSGTTYMQQQQLNHYEHNSHTDNVKKLLHQKITKLLQSIEETNSQADREQLIEMIRLIKGTSDRNWDELVENLQSENSILDFTRLRSELVEDEPLGVPFGDRNTVPMEDVDNDGKDGESLEQTEDASARKQHHSLPSEYEDHQRLMHHQYDSLRHIQEHKSVRAQEHADDSVSAGSVPSATGEQQEQLHHHTHHVVGERIDAHHHLERGPHGSLVIRANKGDEEIHRSRQNGHEIKEKINIHAHELKPNHAGTVVTYEGHHGPSSGAAGAGNHHQHPQPHHPHHQHVHAGHHGHGRMHGLHDHNQHAEHRAAHGHQHQESVQASALAEGQHP
uniref:CTCK domain-containing protein n=1 Tax=Anopheles atroparvus TaxID=41427 RepID=A0AAG5DXS7_ANOAO